MKAAIYVLVSGKINRFIDAPPEAVAAQCQDGEEFYLNCPSGATHIVDGQPVTLAPPPPTNQQKLTALRAKRNMLLASTDFTQLPDVTLPAGKRTEWAIYRQALRDLPETCADLDNPAWPQEP